MKKSIGLDIKPPEKACEDRNCPWHGIVSIRGRVFQGIVKSAKAHNTAVIEWHFYHFVKKYERYERRNTTVLAHNPPCISAKEGDAVVIAECRPISKAKAFSIVGRADRKDIKLDVKETEKKGAMQREAKKHDAEHAPAHKSKGDAV
jgi:small subunit ribosomal protein S17